MGIQLVGVGVGRTGTHSLKLALEHLLGGTCHHMMEVTKDQTSIWTEAYLDNPPDWTDFLDPYCAIVDWPGAGLWRDLVAAFPEAPVLLSTRSSAEVWQKSAANTIFKSMMSVPEKAANAPFLDAMMAAFTSEWRDPDAAKNAYESHNQAIRAAVPADRLFEYQPGDGWGPLCAALRLPIPDSPFPHTNSTAAFQKRMQSRASK